MSRHDDTEPELRRRIPRSAKADGFGRFRRRGSVAGLSDADPIAGWNTITQAHPVLEPADLFGACDRMTGSPEGMAACAETEAPPTVDAAAMHRRYGGQIPRLWRDGHYR
jgi:hypothetical protein